MKALLRKDLAWLSFFLAAGTTIPAVVVMARGFTYIWVLPGTGLLSDCLVIWWFSGLVFGIFAAVREEFTRTEEFLRHRPVSLMRIFTVKTVACLVMIFTWVVVPFFLYMTVSGRIDSTASIARWNLFWVYTGTGAVAFSSFAAGYFVGSLRAFWLKRLLMTAPVSMLALSAASTLANLCGSKDHTSLALFVVVHLAFTLLFVLGAYRNFSMVYDLDRNMKRRTLWITGSLILVSMMFFSGFCLCVIQQWTQAILMSFYPIVVETPSGAVKRLVWNNRTGRYHEVDENHKPIESPELDVKGWGADPATRAWSMADIMLNRRWKRPIWFMGGECRLFDGRWQHIESTQYCLAYLLQPEGMVYLYSHYRAGWPGVPSVKKLGKGSENIPFSREAQALNIQREDKVIMVGDPEDGGIWTYNLKEDGLHFKRTSLPGGDAFESARYLGSILEKYQPTDERVIEGKRYVAEQEDYQSVVFGKRTCYFFTDGSFEEVPEALRTVVETCKPDPASYHYPHYYGSTVFLSGPIKVLREDPIAPVMEPLGEAGQPICRHTYGLYRGREKAAGGVLYACSMLRAPAFQLLSFLDNGRGRAPTFRAAVVIDPLLVSGKRPWLLLCSLGSAALLAFMAVRRLSRFGAGRARIIYWGVWISAGGAAAYLVFRLLETKRAYCVIPQAAPEDLPSMLIKTRDVKTRDARLI